MTLNKQTAGALLCAIAVATHAVAAQSQDHWKEARIVSTPTDVVQTHFQGTSAGEDDSVHMVWMEEAGSGKDLLYARSTNGGVDWAVPETLMSGISPFSEGAAVVAHPSGLVHVVWDAVGSGGGLLHMLSADNGETFGAATIVTPSAGHFSLHLEDNGKLHIIWLNGNSVLQRTRTISGLSLIHI